MSPDEMNAIYQMLGSIDARIAAVQEDVSELKRVQGEIFAKLNKQQSQLDTLQQAHNDRTGQQIDCNGKPTVPKNMIALIGGISSGTSIILLIVLLLILHAMGFTF